MACGSRLAVGLFRPPRRHPTCPAARRPRTVQPLLKIRATNDRWDTVLALVAQQHGEREEQLREDRDNRPYRIGLAADRLRRRLDFSGRGTLWWAMHLPKDYWAFWTARLTLADEDLDEMIDD